MFFRLNQGMWIIYRLGMFLAQWWSQRGVARDHSSLKLNIMVRAVAATVTHDLGSDSSLPKLRNVRQLERHV